MVPVIILSVVIAIMVPNLFLGHRRLAATSVICSVSILNKLVLFGLMLNIPVNSYAHVGTVSSPNHFFLGKLD